ncbi:MAG: HlyD family efflux transporter periplasmic adaptor subunit [Candidatus Korobacteraceae bacterium]|jgi:putative peptide zinc metalloprotease protein
MNILEAFDAALPEMPARSAQRSLPKLDPRVISKEHIEQGVSTVLAKMPGADTYVRLTPEQWMLLESFDGERSYAELSALIREKSGVDFTEDDVKEFASFLRDETDLLYRTPLEKNITLKQKLGAERHKRKRFAFSDITDITLHKWPHADDYLTKLQPYVEFVYTTWFTLLTLACFGVMVWMWLGKLDEIWYDSFRFYNFTEKSVWDLVEFWFLFGAMAFVHESAHGMTCKHFGGNVEKMEFLLMYFAPTFVCDVTQIWVVGERRARLFTIIAGIWADLVICFFATVMWWTTAPGMWVHDFAYKVIMVSGIGVTLLNLNPLIKLDGYYMFSEIIGESDLKERSTLYVSEWVKRHIFSLPVEVEFVPRRRRLLYILYSLFSGLYGYLLIFAVVIFMYHVLHSYSPENAWIPALLVAFLIFKSRIRKLVRFMKDVYLDKKDRVKSWFTPARVVVCLAAALAILFVPLWPDFVEGRFVLEPAHRAVIRAEVPGVVVQVLARENETATPGMPLVRLRNLQLESDAAAADAGYREAAARAINANLHYADFGRADRVREETAERDRLLTNQLKRLELTSPIAGVVLTPNLPDLLGSYVDAGTAIAEVADLSSMTARIYIPEFAIREVRIGTRARLLIESQLLPISGTLTAIAPLSSEIDSGLGEKQQLGGIAPPPFYLGFVTLRNDGILRDGMTGTAKLFVRRRSLADMMARFARDLILRRLW